jgi:hypothetical protein
MTCRSTPETKVCKGGSRSFTSDSGVADRKDVVMELALQDDFVLPCLLYST